MAHTTSTCKPSTNDFSSPGKILLMGFLFLTQITMASADGGVVFHDIASQESSGIEYVRGESPRRAVLDAIKERSILDADNDGVPDQPITPVDLPLFPVKVHGAPGVALFDYDNDGDLDIYVTNGPGVANSLFSSLLRETGRLSFVDVGQAAGVGAADQDSNGTCFGDLDNDGDPDLMVLGANEENRLFENQGDGSFLDITLASGVGGGLRTSTSCSMGDVNGDGLLDIVVANSFSDWSHQLGIFVPFVYHEHNQLLLNLGNNDFVDVSRSSGIEDLDSQPAPGAGSAALTWAIAMVDYDLDGDLDIICADDQGAVPVERNGGLDFGFVRIMNNDGSGHFTDRTLDGYTNKAGTWMGLSFGDLNCDDRMDMFATNFGDFGFAPTPVAFDVGDFSSQWFLGRSNGTFYDPGLGSLVATPFGWGTSMADYDNDADTDIVFHGGLDVNVFIEASNAGVILQNQGCSAQFVYDKAALAASRDHLLRNVQGMAVGDLNEDGFVDIVSVSNFDIPPSTPLVPFYEIAPHVKWGSPFDEEASMVPTFIPTGPGEFVWSGIDVVDGSLAVEISSADNGNHWVAIDVVGTVGLTSQGGVNRDGIGAVITVTPEGGRTSMSPVLGGSSYASQDSLTAHFGLGAAKRSVVEVLWPGGVRNRLYNVAHGERVVFPEIPCGFDGAWGSVREYVSCVEQALDELVDNRTLNRREAARFGASARRAFVDHLER